MFPSCMIYNQQIGSESNFSRKPNVVPVTWCNPMYTKSKPLQTRFLLIKNINIDLSILLVSSLMKKR